MKSQIEQIISRLALVPHPEGGWYRETWRSSEVLTRDDGNIRASGTAIYFLIPEGVKTHWHVVNSAELWHFYSGSPLVLELWNEETQETEEIIMGSAIESGFVPQALVRPNQWQRAYSLGSYSLVGCTVSPGFNFDDFRMTKENPPF